MLLYQWFGYIVLYHKCYLQNSQILAEAVGTLDVDIHYVTKKFRDFRLRYHIFETYVQN